MKNLKAERARYELTQAQAAKRLQVTTRTLSKYENDPLKMNGEVLVKACELFDCSADYLLDRTETRARA